MDNCAEHTLQNYQQQSEDYSAMTLNNIDSNDKSIPQEEISSMQKRPSLPFLSNTNPRQLEELDTQLPISSNYYLSKHIKGNF